jgi:thioredoxin-like negative regulator of GroEL
MQFMRSSKRIVPAGLAASAMLLLVLTACTGGAAPGADGAQAATAAAQHRGDASGIAWHQGDVDSAFAAAAAAHKPILLYWGANWCPPCQQLKSTVFVRPDFIARSRSFVPVYLDGDDAGAQKLGEQFRVTGYPTLVVLDSGRHELMRIAGGLDLGQYAAVLDSALADLEPAADLLSAAAAGRALDAEQCRRLAYNSWELSDRDDAEDARLAQQLPIAAQHCPANARIDRARLQIFAARFASRVESEALKADRPPSAVLHQRLDDLDQVLRNERTAVAVADALQYLDEDCFRAVKAGGATATPWLGRFVRTMDAAASDPDFAEADQLGTIGSKLEAIKTINGAIPAGVARAARARVAAALVESQAPYVRSGIINAVLPIYDLLGQNDRAYTVVKGELKRTATPYYYKADLGDLAEQLGHNDEAIQWFAEGYAEAVGPATRFQWGVSYASSLLRLRPTNVARIRDVTGAVLAELDGPDRIYRRARIRLARLDKALRKWNQDSNGAHAEVLVTLRTRMQQICVKVPQSEPARQTCDAFLAGALLESAARRPPKGL